MYLHPLSFLLPAITGAVQPMVQNQAGHGAQRSSANHEIYFWLFTTFHCFFAGMPAKKL
jgi:hypothetical protein